MHDSTLPQKLDGRAASQPEPPGRHRALQRAINRAADAAMRCQDRVAAANAALRALRAELLWRFELLRSRQQQPTLIDPEPLTAPSCDAQPAANHPEAATLTAPIPEPVHQ